MVRVVTSSIEVFAGHPLPANLKTCWADDLGKRVVIVDTSNEIAGDGDTPHPAVGHARRMQVHQPEYQKRYYD